VSVNFSLLLVKLKPRIETPANARVAKVDFSDSGVPNEAHERSWCDDYSTPPHGDAPLDARISLWILTHLAWEPISSEEC
jgi:hypothetical protein